MLSLELDEQTRESMAKDNVALRRSVFYSPNERFPRILTLEICKADAPAQANQPTWEN